MPSSENKAEELGLREIRATHFRACQSCLQYFPTDDYGSCVYILVDPVTKLPMYVGKTGDLITRINSHLTTNYKTCEWTFSLSAKGLMPLVFFREVPQIAVAELEKFYILSLQSTPGIDLLNTIAGVLNTKPGWLYIKPKTKEELANLAKETGLWCQKLLNRPPPKFEEFNFLDLTVKNWKDTLPPYKFPSLKVSDASLKPLPSVTFFKGRK